MKMFGNNSTTTNRRSFLKYASLTLAIPLLPAQASAKNSSLRDMQKKYEYRIRRDKRAAEEFKDAYSSYLKTKDQKAIRKFLSTQPEFGEDILQPRRFPWKEIAQILTAIAKIVDALYP